MPEGYAVVRGPSIVEMLEDAALVDAVEWLNLEPGTFERRQLRGRINGLATAIALIRNAPNFRTQHVTQTEHKIMQRARRYAPKDDED